MQVRLGRRVFEENDRIAEDLRLRFRELGVSVVNIMGSPGAGKTSLLEKTLQKLNGTCRAGVIEGDIATSLDAERIARLGTPVVQINTGGKCHLDAAMINKALHDLDVSALDLLLIENVGNLVCPVQFDLGEDRKIIVCSLPEGDDKIAKYPAAFSAASAVVLNKLDLLPYLPFDCDGFRQSLRTLNSEAPLFELSCKSGEGVDEWTEWLSRTNPRIA